jgi:hypothetical protein
MFLSLFFLFFLLLFPPPYLPEMLIKIEIFLWDIAHRSEKKYMASRIIYLKLGILESKQQGSNILIHVYIYISVNGYKVIFY